MTHNLFLGLETELPDIKILDGRALKKEDLHITLVFLGAKERQKTLELIKKSPPPPFYLPPVALCKKELFLSSVAAFDVEFLNKRNLFFKWRSALDEFFEIKETRPYIPHITMARGPKNPVFWEKLSFPFPCFFKNLHLYESLGHSRYEKLWTFSFPLIFEPLDHTADYGYVIYGESYDELYLHALATLCFDFPELTSYLNEKSFNSLEDVIIGLNEILSLADEQKGVAIKAISFSSKIQKYGQGLRWEMIIDI